MGEKQCVGTDAARMGYTYYDNRPRKVCALERRWRVGDSRLTLIRWFEECARVTGKMATTPAEFLAPRVLRTCFSKNLRRQTIQILLVGGNHNGCDSLGDRCVLEDLRPTHKRASR